MKKIALISLNKPGLEAAQATVKDLLSIDADFDISVYTNVSGNHCIQFNKLDEIVKSVWNSSDVIIWFTSTGIAVRKITHLIRSKTSDPAVLVMNIARTQVIPLLSGHLGGANEISMKLAEVNKNLTVFTTTATDCLEILSLDNYAKNEGYNIVNIENLAKISNFLINNQPINLITYPVIRDELVKQGLNLNLARFYNYENIDGELDNLPTVVISPFIEPVFPENLDHVFKITIKPLSIGIGLNKNTSLQELEEDFYDFLAKNDLACENVDIISSFEAKRDEKALIQLAQKLNKKLVFFSKEDINSLEYKFSDSKAQQYFDIKGVAEPSAVLASKKKTLFIKKNIYKNTTFAAGV